MSAVKEKMVTIINQQPEDSSYEEILKELAFDRMIREGVEDSKKGNIFSEAEAWDRIKSWQK